MGILAVHLRSDCGAARLASVLSPDAALTIVGVATHVVGVYGMNFEGSPYNMPELGWTYGYPAVMLGMLGVTAVMLAYFRREGWL